MSFNLSKITRRARNFQVVECAVANTWRLPVVWELVSGHLRVVAKAREPAKREYAVRAMRELIVDGVKRLHPHPLSVENDDKDHDGGNGSSSTTTSRGRADVSSAPPPPPTSSIGGGNGALRSTATTMSPASASASASTGGGAVTRTSSRGSAAPTSNSGGIGGGGGQEEGFLPNFLGLRARLEGAMGGEDEQFRWIFDCDVGAVFLVVGGGAAAAARRTTAGGGDGFEGVLFKTMGLFALTPHVDTREATLQTLYSILQV